jgi:hypothetical protein
MRTLQLRVSPQGPKPVIVARLCQAGLGMVGLTSGPDAGSTAGQTQTLSHVGDSNTSTKVPHWTRLLLAS